MEDEVDVEESRRIGREEEESGQPGAGGFDEQAGLIGEVAGGTCVWALVSMRLSPH